ncbi:MAG: DegV family protein [Dehalococcoidia bacterium]|nr:DegV family protein [Dehalococcoidia bacterium]
MREVTVLTDSVACLPPALAEQHRIRIIPVRLSAQGRAYQDTTDEMPPSTIHELQAAPSIDTTPWPPDVYRRAYLEAGSTARCVLHVVAFSQFTSTIALAKAGASLARVEAPDLCIEVFDAATTSMSQGFIALAAARAADEGADIACVVRRAEEVRARVSAAFTLDSLRYLARTGRVPRLTSWASSLLHVMPVVGLTQGRERPLALARSRGQATRRLLEFVRGMAIDEKPLHVAIMAQERDEDAHTLLETIRDQMSPAESMLVTPSPATQAVAGPGFLGVACYSEE